jgi:hypothetical protein
MNFSDYIVYLWLFPFTAQILLPLLVLGGWSLLKLPTVLLQRVAG